MSGNSQKFRLRRLFMHQEISSEQIEVRELERQMQALDVRKREVDEDVVSCTAALDRYALVLPEETNAAYRERSENANRDRVALNAREGSMQDVLKSKKQAISSRLEGIRAIAEREQVAERVARRAGEQNRDAEARAIHHRQDAPNE